MSPSFTRAELLKPTPWQVVALVTLLALGFLATHLVVEWVERVEVRQRRASLHAVDRLIGHEIANIDHMARILARSPWIVDALSHPSPASLGQANEKLDGYCGFSSAAVCYLMDRKGVTVATSNRRAPDSFLGKDYHFRPYFQAAATGDSGRYFAVGVTSRRRGYYAASPVEGAAGEMIGVVAVKMEMDLFEKDLAELDRCFMLSPEGVIFLSSDDAFLLRCLWPLDDLRRDALVKSRQFGEPDVRPILLAPCTDGERVSFEGQRAVVIRESLGIEGWSSVCLLPERAFLPYRLFGWTFSLLVVLLVAGHFAYQRHRARAGKKLEAAYEEMSRAYRAKGEFIANVSHEIRTPMNAILGYADLLRGTPMDDTQRDYLATIRQSGDMLLLLLNDILDAARLEQGHMVLEEVPFDARETLEQAVRIITPSLAGKPVDLRFRAAPEVARRLRGDPTRLRQIALNLLANAVKFTERGEIEMSLLPGGEGIVVLAVRDTGIGIPAGKQQELFRPFQQADASTTRRYGGSGLGLHIVKSLSTLMGGDVTVESRPGEGSLFRVTLRLPPAGEEPPPPPPPSVHPQATVPVTGAFILVADDNAVNRKLVTVMLEKLGCRVEAVEDGRRAVAAFDRGRHDLVLMDLHMPEMDGLEATRAIRELSKAVPIVAFTAAAMPEDQENARQAGMDGFLGKPVLAADLRECLARHLSWTPGPGPAAPAQA